MQLASEQRSVIYHLYTIWLFTLNDLKSIVLPETVFGVFSALSGSRLTSNAAPQPWDIFARLPQVIIWNWFHLLLFDVSNQRLPGSIKEDQVNKPWRPIPSRRLTEEEARRFMLALPPVVYFITLLLGGQYESLMGMILAWMYNDLGGADENPFVRNIINACGFVCFSSGSTVVAAGYGHHKLNEQAYPWLTIVGLIVFSTLQMQDLKDMEGDAARGRKTLPLVYGERVAQWSVAVPVIIWSLLCPTFWGCGLFGYGASTIFGGLVSFRVLLFSGQAAHQKTWTYWCVWTTIVYILPCWSRI